MKLLLINPPTLRHDTRYLAPPLALALLAAVARDDGHPATILDFNLEVVETPALWDTTRFNELAVEEILKKDFDVLCLTSMCLESHVSLQIGQAVKELRPEIVTIFGGTHFGAIAVEVLESYAYADFVVAGEGEHAILSILRRLNKGCGEVPSNVWYRESGKILRGTLNPSKVELEELPFPAYDLVDLQRYFALNTDRLLNYEAGRGCIFKCSFCYSPFQYSDAVRNKRVEDVVEDLRRLANLGAKHIFFVQDNLLNSRVWAVALCNALARANLPITWECYATYPQLNEELIDALARAGCIGIFTGIDAVTDPSQRRMNKRFLKSWESAERKLTYCRARGIVPICAFILEGPNQIANEIDAMINTAIRCLDVGSEIHINTLSIYNGTTLSLSTRPSEYSYSEIKPQLLLDTPSVVQSNSLAKRAPHLFPYHSTRDALEQWERFTTKAYTLWSVLLALTNTCRQYALEEGHSIWELLRYVDDDLVRITKATPIEHRRLQALLQFVTRFKTYPLSETTKGFLSREVARMILASGDGPKLVKVRRDRRVTTYTLASFVAVSEASSIPDIQLLESARSDFPETTNPSLEFALRAEDGTFRFFILTQERVKLLRELISASTRNEPLALSDDDVSQLKNEGWIWPLASKPGAPQLEKATVAA